MKNAKKMDYKDKNDALKSILKIYLKIDKNLLLCERLFVANTAINWIFDNTKQSVVINHYMKDIEKYLKGEIDLCWSNGVLTKKKKTNEK